MKRLNNVLSDDRYVNRIKKIKEFEVNRDFCRHNIEHFKDVSRILYILSLEEGIELSKEIIYTIGMLHDIGRGTQYEDGTPHEVAGSQIARELMMDHGYSEEEMKLVQEAIMAHRRLKADGSLLEKLTYRADKLSRDCAFCEVSISCNWDQDEKNIEIKY